MAQKGATVAGLAVQVVETAATTPLCTVKLCLEVIECVQEDRPA